MDRYGPDTALVVVDMQNDFVHPDGSLYVSGGEQVVHRVNDEITAARAAGSTVVYTQDWHPPDTQHFVDQGGKWPPHCVKETWGAEFHRDLRLPEDPLIVRKGTGYEDGYSGFTVYDLENDSDKPTQLDRMLSEHDIQRTVIVGVATDVCVKATALDAAEIGYDTEVVREATAPVEEQPGDGDRAIADMAAAGVSIVEPVS